MAITTLPTPAPARNQEAAEYVTNWDNLLAALPTLVTEIDAAVVAFNLNATNSTSTTSLLISVASKTLTVQASKSYVVGMTVTIAYTTDATQWMRGIVTAYDSGTGSLTVSVSYISSVTGTYTAWTISQTAIEDSVTDSLLLLDTGNGFGSTSTSIRLLTTTTTNTGTAFSVSHSATLGTVITINETGIYAFHYTDFKGAANATYALTINATGAELTGNYSSIARSRWVGSIEVIENTAGQQTFLTAVDKLTTGDTVRIHNNTSNQSDGTTTVHLMARRIGNV